MKIKFWTEEGEGAAKGGGALAGYFGRLELDDRPVPDVTDFSLQASLDDAIRASVKVLATKALDIEVDAQRAEIMIVVVPGYRVVKDTLPNGRERCWAEPMETFDADRSE
jgi:hypothetical protein